MGIHIILLFVINIQISIGCLKVHAWAHIVFLCCDDWWPLDNSPKHIDSLSESYFPCMGLSLAVVVVVLAFADIIIIFFSHYHFLRIQFLCDDEVSFILFWFKSTNDGLTITELDMLRVPHDDRNIAIERK